ncbi:hypothetical protein [Pantoea sp. SM3]|uniref:hypothetical protein n=1 Tax=Pantoea sp. SM3 TaxID=1628192 RepID=UPI0005F7F400|nr:hypothetical protein [Pantoea sp. SM3]KJV35874.1 hypothetical protein VI01_00035 [Pantoea sp. SM3]
MHKVYAVDSAGSIKNAELINQFNREDSIELTQFIPENFIGKVVFSIEEVDLLNQSIVSIKDNYRIQLEHEINSDFIFRIQTNDASINDFYNDSFKINSHEKRYLYVVSSIDIPFIAKGGVPESKERYVRMSEVLNIFIVSAKNNGSEILPCPPSQVFDGYGTLGFAVVDISKFDKYISMNAESNDLIEEFTTTEIANELFDKGLMILSWGHTPWVYYVNSVNYDKVSPLIGEQTIYSGIYKLQNTSGYYSVIPGNELKNWHECKKKKWPVISLDGEGDFVSLTLYIKSAFSQSDSNYPIPTFHLQRLESEGEAVNPLLESNILYLQ